MFSNTFSPHRTHTCIYHNIFGTYSGYSVRKKLLSFMYELNGLIITNKYL